jgi:hypothetical protein
MCYIPYLSYRLRRNIIYLRNVFSKYKNQVSFTYN